MTLRCINSENEKRNEYSQVEKGRKEKKQERMTENRKSRRHCGICLAPGRKRQCLFLFQ